MKFLKFGPMIFGQFDRVSVSKFAVFSRDRNQLQPTYDKEVEIRMEHRGLNLKPSLPHRYVKCATAVWVRFV